AMARPLFFERRDTKRHTRQKKQKFLFIGKYSRKGAENKSKKRLEINAVGTRHGASAIKVAKRCCCG
ncbi:MAG: hypothetical protein K2L21_07455, partial [Muribaculaceae bacterium]|nr:hypothetical protein [Muribaculaceae bacterium]